MAKLSTLMVDLLSLILDTSGMIVTKDIHLPHNVIVLSQHIHNRWQRDSTTCDIHHEEMKLGNSIKLL